MQSATNLRSGSKLELRPAVVAHRDGDQAGVACPVADWPMGPYAVPEVEPTFVRLECSGGVRWSKSASWTGGLPRGVRQGLHPGCRAGVPSVHGPRWTAGFDRFQCGRLRRQAGPGNDARGPTRVVSPRCTWNARRTDDARQTATRSRAAAKPKGCKTRVVRRDGVAPLLTLELDMSRINVTINDGVITAVETDAPCSRVKEVRPTCAGAHRATQEPTPARPDPPRP